MKHDAMFHSLSYVSHIMFTVVIASYDMLNKEMLSLKSPLLLSNNEPKYWIELRFDPF